MRCNSMALQITRKVTEFSFKEKGSHATTKASAQVQMNSCLLNCHAEVWTRFPVLPTISRSTCLNTAHRKARALLLVTGKHHSFFQPHMKSLIAAFAKKTKKPTGEELSDLVLEAKTFEDLLHQSPASWSTVFAGEWLADIICLIPIHIAVARDNRFIPLKDSVLSSEFERTLVGATVDQITDNLSFRWYESIFHSYMVTKVCLLATTRNEGD